jgi:murein DD-endopeptidase MepM/ murein hydrolase activator NlpD
VTLKTSLIITGDSSVARKEVADLAQAVTAAAASTKAAVAPAAELDAAQKRTAESARDSAAASKTAGAAIEETTRTTQTAAAAAGALERANAELTGQVSQAQAVIGTLAAELRQASSAMGALEADAKRSQSSIAGMEGELRAAEASIAGLASRIDILETKLSGAGAETRQYESAIAKLRAELDPAGEAQRELASQIDIANKALARGAITQEQYDGHLKKLTADTTEASEVSARHAFGMRNLGQQFGDFATQVSLGGGVVRAFSSQAGQMGYALSEMGGTAGKVGAFMTGPWGIALTIGALALGPLLESLDKTEDKTKSLKDTEEEYGKFQANLANFIDTANGKLRDRVGLLAQIAVQEGKATIKKADEQQQTFGKQAFAAANAGAITGYAFTAERQASTPTYDLRVVKAIGDANNDVGKLIANLNQLAKTDPKLQPLADSVAHLGGQSVYAAQQAGKLRAEQAQLNTAIHGGVIETAAMIERQVATQAATSGVEKAQARLNDVKARGAAIDQELYGPKKVADLAKYKADLLSATNALKAAQDAAKDAGKAGFNTAFLSPVAGGRVTTQFGQRESGRGEIGSHLHEGVDYAVPVGTPIRAPAAGTIDVAGSRSGYGNAIYINFGAGTQARFGHLSKFNVKPGDVVNAGDVIGYTGGAAGAAGSGDSTGPHLHYEVRRNGRAVNPTIGHFATDAGQAGDAAQKLQDAADKKHTEELAHQAELLRTSGNTIESINASWGQQATLVARAVAPTNQLNDIIGKLQKEKPPGFEKLIADAQAAKVAIQEGIQRPYNEFIRDQSAQIGQLALIAQGRHDEADALETIVGLERQQGPLTQAQKDAVLATVQARKAEQREIDILQEKNQKYLDAIGSIKTAVQDATQAFVRGELGQFIKTPGKLLSAFETLQGQKLFDKLFGGAFRDLQDQVNGTSPVRDASERMAAAVNKVSAQTDRTTSALANLASATNAATAAVSPRSSGGAVGASADQLGTFTGELGGAISGALSRSDLADDVNRLGNILGNGSGGYVSTQSPGDITVVGQRKTDPSDIFAKGADKVSTSILGLFTNKDNASAIGASIGRYAGKGLEGAATGTMISGLANAVGLKLNSTGAQVGGAIGNMIPIPGGQIIGSVLGGLVGNLFGPKAKPGGAVVSAVDGSAAISGTTGSDKAGIAAGNTLAGGVASSINQIAEQLGATIGAFNVSIGKYKDDLRVNVNGKALGGVKNSGATSFGDDENAAVNFAAAQAIGQGAIQGVSAAVTKALQSSPDIDKALKEALKVQSLEQTIGGIGAQIDKAFSDFEATAKERVRIASQYGFDVVAIEKKNAEDRAKLADQLLKQQVGSLQSLVDEMTQGSLFEGSALDKITALNTAITKAKADLDAGVDGAGDTLANLFKERLDADKEAYGTTAKYAADRASTFDEARAAIAKANAQITAAQGKSDPALATTNATLDENNDQNAQIIAGQDTTNQLLAKLVAADNGFSGDASGKPDLRLTARSLS